MYEILRVLEQSGQLVSVGCMVWRVSQQIRRSEVPSPHIVGSYGSYQPLIDPNGDGLFRLQIRSAVIVTHASMLASSEDRR